MILLTILGIMLATLIAITTLAISVGGSVAVVLFSDVIVCIVFIVLIIKKIVSR